MITKNKTKTVLTFAIMAIAVLALTAASASAAVDYNTGDPNDDPNLPPSAATMSTGPAPEVNYLDVANYGTATSTDKWFTGDSAKGQTFTTGSDAALLNSITYQVAATQKAEPVKEYVIRIGTVSGTTFTEIYTETATQDFTWNSSEYMTWTLDTPVLLSPDTEYGIDVGMTSSTTEWPTGIPYINMTADKYDGGMRYTSGTSGIGTDALTLDSTRDRIFHIDMFYANPNATMVYAGVDMITWIGEPVLMDPDISDPSGSDCYWSTDFDDPNAVTISDPDIVTPTVTVNFSLTGPKPILQNAGFELPVFPIDDPDDDPDEGMLIRHTRFQPVDWTPGWSQSQSNTGPDSSIFHGSGAMHYMYSNTYDQVAPEGVNTGYVRTPNKNYDTYLNQHLPIKLQANSQYDLSVLVGQPQKWNSTPCYRDESGPDYHLELVAGGAVVYQTGRTDSPPDAETWDLATLSWTCPPIHVKIGELMEIRLFVHYQNDIPCGDTYGEYQINFDDVRFTVDGSSLYTPLNTITMTLDVGGTADTMDIDVHEDACLAAVAAGIATTGYDASDVNTDCNTDLFDFAELAADWLDEYSATGPVPKL